jgi:hypothetical protein
MAAWYWRALELLARPAWPRHTLLVYDYQRASRKPAPPFLSSLKHHVSPRAEHVCNCAFAFSAIFAGCWRAPDNFLTALFFTGEVCARTAGRASAWAPRLSTRNAQRRNVEIIFRHKTGGSAGNVLCTSIKFRCPVFVREAQVFSLCSF